MNNEIKFKSLEELYNRLKPALYSKVQELKRNHIDYIKEEDIWNYLTLKDWKERKSLTITDMTNDILNLDNDLVKLYVLENLKNEKRNIKYEEEDLL